MWVQSPVRLKRNVLRRLSVGLGTRRATYASVVLMMIGACGNSTQHDSATTTSTTTTPTLNPSQVTNRCTQAFATAPSAGQTQAHAPADMFVIDVTDNLRANLSTVQNAYNGRSFYVWHDWYESWGAAGTNNQTVTETRDPAKLSTLICVKRTYEILGSYENSHAPAGRCDYDVRVVDWRNGAVLALQQFQGENPPDSADMQSNNGSGLVIGRPPEVPLGTWLSQVVTG